jgi:hypothetical protein
MTGRGGGCGVACVLGGGLKGLTAPVWPLENRERGVGGGAALAEALVRNAESGVEGVANGFICWGKLPAEDDFCTVGNAESEGRNKELFCRNVDAPSFGGCLGWGKAFDKRAASVAPDKDAAWRIGGRSCTKVMASRTVGWPPAPGRYRDASSAESASWSESWPYRELYTSAFSSETKPAALDRSRRGKAILPSAASLRIWVS